MWGVDAPLGRNFPSRLPGHEGHASFYFDAKKTGTWKYRCWCHEKFWSLADLRATTASGELKKRKKAEATVWYRRLWHEAGLIEPAPVPMPPLPDTVDDVVRDVARGFELLLGLRWLTHPGEPMPFARKLAGPWSGRSPKQAYRAIGVLEKHGTIRVLDTIVNTGKIGITPLYGPGIVAPRESTR